MAQNKQQVRMVFKLAAFGAFIMLGYLGLRSYRLSVEKLKAGKCIEEIGEIVMNVRDRLKGNYAGLDYFFADKLNVFPKSMAKEGYREKINSYLGGVDIYYSSLDKGIEDRAFEVSFQGLSSFGCKELIKMNWEGDFLIAVAGYAKATPSGVLDEIYLGTKPEDIPNRNIYKGNLGRFVSEDKLDYACSCGGNTCTVVWKFR